MPRQAFHHGCVLHYPRMELFYPLYPQYGTSYGMISTEIQNTLHQHDISIDIYEYFDGQLSEFISLQF